jgi:hypothetical protein
MSTDPTGLSGRESCVQATAKKYINVDFDMRDWCGYEGDCLINSLPMGKERACMLCKYRVPLDIPSILRIKMKERTEIMWRKFK